MTIPQELGDCELELGDAVGDGFELLDELLEELPDELPDEPPDEPLPDEPLPVEPLPVDGELAGVAAGVEPEPDPSLELELESPPVFAPAPSLDPDLFDVASARESLR